MNYFSLVLNNSYQPIRFINYKKAVNFIVKSKIDIINNWDIKLSPKISLPATCRIKYYTPFFAKKLVPNRKTILMRDQYTCQYCGYPGTYKDMTVDHILPKSLGGQNSLSNCVAACKPCNSFKDARLPEQAGMKLINSIDHYSSAIKLEFLSLKNKHPDWDLFFK